MRFVRLSVAALLSGAVYCTPAGAAQECSQLPSSLQNAGIGQISSVSELQSLDEKLDGYLQPCLQPVGAGNAEAICSNGKLAAEQVLRVVGRIDAAGRHNAVLANARMKSYRTGAALLERMKRLSADRTCS